MAGTVGEVSGPRFLHSSLRKDSFDTSPLMVSPLKGDRPDDKGSPAGGLGSPNWKLLVGMAAVSVIISYADRSNISTAILPMATDFGWDKAFQGVVLSSFFAGYALTQMLGGQLADRYGGKIVLTAGISIWSICTGLIPMAAAAGTVPLLGMRVLLGLGEGVAFPAIHSLIARNVPYASRGTAVGLVTAASYGGTALAFGVSPWLIANWGWPSVFHIFAGLALIWLPLWLPLEVKPQQDQIPLSLPGLSPPSGAAPAAAPPTAAENGSDPLATSISAAGNGASSSTTAAPLIDPGLWALIRRREVWAICVAQYCQSWGMYGLLSWLPTFFADYYKVELADLATYTLVPYLVQGGVGAASGILADNLISNGWSVRSVRVAMQVAGMIGPGVCLLAAVSPLVGESASAASTLITVGLGFSALSLAGVSTNHLDIAPKHAGLIFGAGNTAATLAGFLSVPITGYILQATNSWPLVFGVTAAHYVVGSVFWVMWVGERPLPEDSIPPVERKEARSLQ